MEDSLNHRLDGLQRFRGWGSAGRSLLRVRVGKPTYCNGYKLWSRPGGRSYKHLISVNLYRRIGYGISIALLNQSLDLFVRLISYRGGQEEERNADLRSLRCHLKPKMSELELGFALLNPTYGCWSRLGEHLYDRI